MFFCVETSDINFELLKLRLNRQRLLFYAKVFIDFGFPLLHDNIISKDDFNDAIELGALAIEFEVCISSRSPFLLFESLSVPVNENQTVCLPGTIASCIATALSFVRLLLLLITTNIYTKKKNKKKNRGGSNNNNTFFFFGDVSPNKRTQWSSP